MVPTITEMSLVFNGVLNSDWIVLGIFLHFQAGSGAIRLVKLIISEGAGRICNVSAEYLEFILQRLDLN